MMQPYRLATASNASPTCLHPPLRACPPPPRSRAPLVLAAALAIASGAGLWATHAIAHGGQVEIAPRALAALAPRPHLERGRTRVRTPPAPPPRTTSEQALLAGAHDPLKLAARTRTLEAMGADISLSEVELPRVFTEKETLDGFWPTSFMPVNDASGRLAGLEVRSLPRDSPLRVAGLSEGDVVLGIDGYRFEDLGVREVDVLGIRQRGSLVVEIARGRHHVVLAIRWPTAGKKLR